MIRFDGIGLRFGVRAILDGVDFVVGARDRIGLVGPNGAGKTTVLRLLAGELEADSGRMEKAHYVTIGYLPQDGEEGTEMPLVTELETAFGEVENLKLEQAELERDLGELEVGSEAYQEVLLQLAQIDDHLKTLDAHTVTARIERVLEGLGFERATFGNPTRTFSGGWLMRIALARLLLSEPSLLIMDEPTNHLDVASQRWLERYLAGYAGSVLVVSHDRAFLDTVCSRTFALEGGDLHVYEGNYSYYEQQEILRYERLVKEKNAQERKLARQEAFIERFRYKASKARQVQSRIKALDRIERIELREEGPSIRFRFPPAPPCGRVVLTANRLCKRYGANRVLAGVDLTLEKGQKLAVVGNNGAGKSTLVRLLAGVEPADSGEVEVSNGVGIGWFAQHQAESLDRGLTVLESVEQVGAGLGTTWLRSVLGAFLFRGDDVFKRVAVLSGGERNRLALARILLQPVNCLILDEPTNHLDMDSKEVLQEALQHYDGAIVLVSHDRAFIDPVVNRVVEVANGKLTAFPGNLSDYIAHLDLIEGTAVAPADTPVSRQSGARTGGDAKKVRRQEVAERNRRLAPLRRKIELLENEISVLEEEQAILETAMAQPDFYARGDATQADLQRYAEIKSKIATACEEWEAMSTEVDSLTN